MSWRRVAPTLLASAFALAYVIISPRSLDLAAHLARAELFRREGFGLWDNWWYAGHHTPGYSVLFPPLAAALTPQVVGAVSAVLTAWLFELLVFGVFGEPAWLGALWFGAATAVNLYTGRLAFAFGLLFAVAAALALQRRRPAWAAIAAVASALASPVAALFAALGAVAYGAGALIADRDRRAALAGATTAAAALLPVLVLAVAFPEGGSEPFTLATLWPVALIAALLAVLPASATDADRRTLMVFRVGGVLYLAGCLLAYAIPTPAGSNVARLGSLTAGPVAALLLWRRREWWLAGLALPLLYLAVQAPVRDVRDAAGQPAAGRTYWQPLLAFLRRQSGPPFRIEIPFTAFHGEAYAVAPSFPLARGWERQLDIAGNTLFYSTPLTASTYAAWLHRMAVRFVVATDARLDYSAHKEQALLDSGLPYLRPVWRSRHFTVYAVADPTPIVSGAATLTALGPDSLNVRATRAGTAAVRVHFTPYWRLTGVPGCVAPAGDWTRLTLRRAGDARLVIGFAVGRIGARSPRCTPG